MTDCRMRPELLTVEDVLAIHRDQLSRYGGEAGLLSLPALESAVAQAYATFDAKFLHGDLFLMAAAYLFHVTRGHGFVDGNKRTAYAAAIVFLRINGIVVPFSETLYELAMAVAQGRADKEAIADELRRLAANELPETTA
jgi:death on curing protein